MPAPATASVDATTIRERFNWDWAYSNPVDGLDTDWWYAVSIRVDPNEVWAEDGEGDLWVVPFSTDGEDTITFGDPTRSRLVAVPVGTTDGAAATAVVDRRRQKALATNLDRPDKSAGRNPAASERPTTQEDQVPDITPDQLQRLRALPEDANQEQIDAALTEPTPDPQNDPAPDPAADPDPPETAPVPDPVTPDPDPAPDPAAASASEIRDALGLPATATDTDVRTAIAEIQSGARAGADLQAAQIAAGRDKLVDDAVSDGRIAPSARAAWRTALDRQPKAEADALAALPKGRIPVTPAASAATSDEEALLNASRTRMGDITKGA